MIIKKLNVFHQGTGCNEHQRETEQNIHIRLRTNSKEMSGGEYYGNPPAEGRGRGGYSRPPYRGARRGGVLMEMAQRGGYGGGEATWQRAHHHQHNPYFGGRGGGGGPPAPPTTTNTGNGGTIMFYSSVLKARGEATTSESEVFQQLVRSGVIKSAPSHFGRQMSRLRAFERGMTADKNAFMSALERQRLADCAELAEEYNADGLFEWEDDGVEALEEDQHDDEGGDAAADGEEAPSLYHRDNAGLAELTTCSSVEDAIVENGTTDDGQRLKRPRSQSRDAHESPSPSKDGLISVGSLPIDPRHQEGTGHPQEEVLATAADVVIVKRKKGLLSRFE